VAPDVLLVGLAGVAQICLVPAPNEGGSYAGLLIIVEDSGFDRVGASIAVSGSDGENGGA